MSEVSKLQRTYAKRILMATREQFAKNVWPLVEQLYLASADNQARYTYSQSTESEKRIVMKDFVQRQSTKSQRWATIAQNFLIAERDI